MTKRSISADAAPSRPMTIAVAGTGVHADAWARALRGIDAVEIQRLPTMTDDDLLAQLAHPEIDAVAFALGDGAPPVADIAAAIRRVVMAGRHVLVSGPVALSSKQLRALDDLARRRARVILFDAAGMADDRIAFVRKMTAGAHALWHPRYIRSLRTGVCGRATLDELAIGDLSVVLTLAGSLPAQVAAVAPRFDDESGAVDAVMTTLSFVSGVIARVDVSLVEPMRRQEIVIACGGRTIVLDALDPRAPLQIQATAGHRGPQRDGQWSETITEHPIVESADPHSRVAAAFVAAIRAGDTAATNAHVLANAALVWETARASIARGGEPLSLATTDIIVENRPSLHVIQGGGHTTDGRAAPVLTLVSSGTNRTA